MVGRKGTDWRRAIQNDKQATKWRQKKTEKFIMYGQSAYWFYHAVMRTAEIIRWDLSMRHTTNDISSFITSFRYNFTTLDVSFELRRDDAHRFLEWMDLVEYHWYGNESSGRYDTRSFSYFCRTCLHTYGALNCAIWYSSLWLNHFTDKSSGKIVNAKTFTTTATAVLGVKPCATQIFVIYFRFSRNNIQW